jgi:hypothetical protein
MNFRCYHVSLIVPDLDEAMETIGRDLRLSWRPIQSSPKKWIDDAGESHECIVRLTASVEGPPAIELLERTEGDWRAGDPGPMHHLGLWVTDLPGEAAKLQERGWQLRDTYPGPTGEPTNMAYLRSSYGVLVELVDCTRPRGWVQDLVPGEHAASGDR